MTSNEVLTLLLDHYQFAHCLLLPNLRIGTGFGKDGEGWIDLWVIHPHPSKMFRRSYEIKVSREDFQRELRKPNKRRPALRLSNEYYFAAPPGIIKREDVPIECGLVEVDPTAKSRYTTIVPAPWRDTEPPTWRFVAALARRVLDLTPKPDEA